MPTQKKIYFLFLQRRLGSPPRGGAPVVANLFLPPLPQPPPPGQPLSPTFHRVVVFMIQSYPFLLRLRKRAAPPRPRHVSSCVEIDVWPSKDCERGATTALHQSERNIGGKNGPNPTPAPMRLSSSWDKSACLVTPSSSSRRLLPQPDGDPLPCSTGATTDVIYRGLHHIDVRQGSINPAASRVGG